MEANPANLLDSLSNKKAMFFIPPYQRNYEWSHEICSVFLDDVRRVAASNRAGETAEHFFGSIVYVTEGGGLGQTTRYVLTDGQQRITTTMLLLMALRDAMENPSHRQTIQEDYLENSKAGGPPEHKIKLKQVETDWEAYKLLALGEDVPRHLRQSAVFKNYKLFFDSLKELSESERKSLLEDGLMKFSIISIRLEPDRNPWENPQEIFESMNSLGKPLSLADLVRNYLLMGRKASEQTELYDRYWLQLEKRLPDRLSDFVRDWMQADQHKSHRKATESNFKGLYAHFKETVKGRQTEELFEDLVRFSKPYAMAVGLAETGSAPLDAAISDINLIQAATLHSYLAELLAARDEGAISDDATTALVKALRTYLLRRRILQLSAGENTFFPTLGAQLGKLIESSDPVKELFDQLSSSEHARRLPSDDELVPHLRTMNFYNLGRSGNYPKLLLAMIEEELTKARPVLGDSHLQLEHIMPQTITEAWREELGEYADRDHQELLNNLGNITLIRHNQELGNRPFVRKKEVYSRQSGLQVAQNRILDRDKWGAASIKRRREYLVKMLTDRVLAVPPERRKANNWRQASKGSFDSKRVLGALIGETIHFVDDESVTAEIVSSTQVLFEGKKWHLSPLTKELKGRANRVSKSAAYQGASYWTWEGTRLTDLDV